MYIIKVFITCIIMHYKGIHNVHYNALIPKLPCIGCVLWFILSKDVTMNIISVNNALWHAWQDIINAWHNIEMHGMHML